MKNIFSLIIIIIFAASIIYAQENLTALTAKELLQKSIDISTPKTMISTAKQIAYFQNGKKREFKIKNLSKNGNEKILFIYEYPSRLKGNKFLFLKGGDIWAYFAKTGRKRRIASSARKSKMQGSDFSYEDISMFTTLIDGFNSKIIKEEKLKGKECHVIELKPKDKNKMSYNKLLCWIDKEDMVMRKFEYYINDKLDKLMIQKDFKKIKNYLIPYKMIMESKKNNTKTESIIKKVEVDVEIDDRKFNAKTW